MIVAFAATHCLRHPDRRYISHAVGGILGDIFARLRAAFLGRLQEAVVRRRHFL